MGEIVESGFARDRAQLNDDHLAPGEVPRRLLEQIAMSECLHPAAISLAPWLERAHRQVRELGLAWLEGAPGESCTGRLDRVAELEFRVLGRVEVLRGGENVAVGQGSTLNLLAGLLMSANTPVSADALAEIAWGEALPASPRAAVHSKVYRLRRLLGGDVIERVGEASPLRPAADELDLLRFESLVAGAAEAASDEETAASLADAIGLWRGDPLANTDSPVLASGDVPRLTERYLAACEQWARVSIRLRRAAEVVQLVAPLVDAHPFREPIVRLLMLALYQDRPQADALTVYDTLRRRLSEELGVDPSAALQDLHATILHGTPAGPDRTQPEPGPPPGRLTG